MREENQAPIPEPRPAEPPSVPAELAARGRRPGLLLWAALLLIPGLGSLFAGLPEVAGMIALGGLFAAAQAADADPTWRRTYEVFAPVPPLGGALVFGYLAFVLIQSDLGLLARAVAVAFSAAGVVVCAASAHPGVADAAANRLFGPADPSLTRRLAARIALAGFMIAVPSWFAFASMRQGLLENPAPLLEQQRLLGGLVGEVLLALGAVGCWVRRDLGQSLERLGVRPLTRVHLGAVVLGVGALFALNTGAEALQHRFFPELWKADLEMTRMLASDLTPAHIVLLALSAGIGEEVTLRGALQPRLGIARTALLFSALHVQYSWFGILLVFTLGVTLGIVRARTSTTAAMLVHTIYDALAVFGT